MREIKVVALKNTAEVRGILDVFSGLYMQGVTMGFVHVNNLGQIAQSQSVKEDVLLSIFSSFGFFGKLFCAPLSTVARSVVSIDNATYSPMWYATT